MTKSYFPHLVAHLRFVNSIPTAKELRYIHSQFARLGQLVHYTDYLSKAGYRHHSGRSMAVYRYADNNDKLNLRRTLEDICGLIKLSDFERMKEQGDDGEAEVEPFYSLGKLTRSELAQEDNIEVSHASLEDPFFRVNDLNLVGGDTTKVKIDGSYCIPLSVRVQELT